MRTKAIVIRKTPANEYDQIVTLYSEDFGTMRAMARECASRRQSSRCIWNYSMPWSLR